MQYDIFVYVAMEGKFSKHRILKVKEILKKNYEDGIIQHLTEEHKYKVINRLDSQQLTRLRSRWENEKHEDLSVVGVMFQTKLADRQRTSTIEVLPQKEKELYNRLIKLKLN